MLDSDFEVAVSRIFDTRLPRCFLFALLLFKNDHSLSPFRGSWLLVAPELNVVQRVTLFALYLSTSVGAFAVLQAWCVR